MADNEKQDLLLNVEISGDSKKLKKVLTDISNGLADAISSSLTKSVKTFATNLGKNIQISFDATVLKSLEGPIKLVLDTKDAKKKIKDLRDLAEPLKNALASINEDNQATKKSKVTKSKLDIAKPANILTGLKIDAESFGVPGRNIVKQIETLSLALDQLKSKADDENLFGPSQVNQLERYSLKIQQIGRDINLLREQQTFQSAEERSKFDAKVLKDTALQVKNPRIALDLSGPSDEVDKLKTELEEFGVEGRTLAKQVDGLRLSFDLLGNKVGDDGLFNKSQADQLERFSARIKTITKDLELLRQKQSFNESEEVNKFNDSILAEQKRKLKNPRVALDLGTPSAEVDQLRVKAEAFGVEGRNLLKQINGLGLSLDQLGKKADDDKLFGKTEVDRLERYKNKINQLFEDLEVLRQKDLFNQSEEQSKFDEKVIRDKFKAAKEAEKYGNQLAADLKRQFSEADKQAKEAADNAAKAAKEATTTGQTNFIKNIGLETVDKEFDKLNIKLTAVRKEISESPFEVPLGDITKKTSNFEDAIINARNAVKRLKEQLDTGQISEEDANKKFKQLNETLEKTRIAIDNVKDRAKDIGEAFKADQVDRFRKGIITNLAVLGFTLERIGGQLQQFGQQALTTFSQLATAAQPIEQARNIIDQNFVKTGKLSVEQSGALLNNLRELADLPGNNLKDTTAQFLRFTDALGDTNTALDLTKGLIALSANTGVDKSNELTQILLDARTKDRGFNQDSFGKIQSLGGQNVIKALGDAGITSTTKANDAGTAKVIRILAKELSKLEAPALTTADRFNALSNRVAELGESFGKILSPALEQLNVLLKERILPAIDSLFDRFQKLSPENKLFISQLTLAVPVLAIVGGALLSLAGALSFVGVVIGQVLKFGNLIKATFAGAGGVSGIIGKLTGIFEGLSLSIAGTGTGFLRLLRVFGLTNPITIAINLILSAFTALYTNFNGIRDRSALVFSGLNDSVNKLLKALNLEEGGILYVLQLIGEALEGIFGFVGEVVLDVLNALAINFADIINSFARLITFLKQGDYVSAFGEAFRGVFITLFGLAKSLGVELVATLGDAIAALIEKSLGKGVISGTFRDASDGIRELNGTDKASLQEKALIDYRLASEKKITDIREQANKDALDKEKERQEKIKDSIKKLNSSVESAKEDFIKFRFEQVIKDFQSINDIIKDNTASQVENFKLIAESTQNINQITESYGTTVKAINSNLTNLIDSQNRGNLAKALSDFQTATSDKNSTFKEIYNLANNGAAGFKELAKAIDSVGRSNSIEELNSALSQTQTLADNLPTNLGLDSNIILAVRNTIEKTRVSIAESNKDSQKYILEYRKIIQDLQKVEIERRAALEIEARNTAFESKQREIDHKRRLIEIRNSTAENIRSRGPVLGETEASLRDLDDSRQRLEKLRDEVASSQKELANLRTEYKKELELQATSQDAYTQSIANSKLQNIEYSITVDKAEEYNKIQNNITQSQLQFNEADAAYTKQSKEAARTRTLVLYKNIGEALRNITGLLNPEALKKFTDAFSKFLLLGTNDTSRGLEGTTNKLGDLVQVFEDLKNKTKELPNSGKYIGAIDDTLAGLQSRAITTGDAFQNLINILAQLNSEDAINKTIDAQRKLLLLVKDFNKDRTNGVLNPNVIAGGNVGEVLQGLTIDPAQGTEGSGTNLLDKLRNLSGVSEDIRNSFKTSLESFDVSQISTDEFSETFVNLLSKLTEDELKSVFDQLFSDPNIPGEAANKSEILLAFIEKYTAQQAEKITVANNTLKARLDAVESLSLLQSTGISNRIEEEKANDAALELQLRTATGKRRDILLAEQNEIKIKLIDFNYQKLDIEEAYEIQRLLLQAGANEKERAEIEKNGLLRRQQLIEQRNLEIRDLAESRGLLTDKDGNVLGPDGKPIKLSTPTQGVNLGTNDTSGSRVNNTRPSTTEGGDTAVLDKIAAVNTGLITAEDKFLNVGNKASEAGSKVLDFFNSLASGQGVINDFDAMLGGLGFSLDALGETFKDLAIAGVAAFGKAIGDAIVDTLVNGGNFLKNLGKFFGDTLIALGSQLVQLGTAAIALAALGTFFPILRPITGGSEGFAIGAVALATGIGLILAGKALGGGGKAAASASNSNATNSANSKAGNSGQVTYDPEKDPKVIYQKALQAQVTIDIKTDDGQIVKTFVKTVNRDPRLGNLIGNRTTGFAL